IRLTLWVVTMMPFRRMLGYGPTSTITLSPLTDGRAAMGARFGNVTVQPSAVDVALSRNVVIVLSPFSVLAVTVQVPARSANESGGGGGGVAGAAAVAVESDLAGGWDFSQAASRTPQQQAAVRRRIMRSV